MLSKLRRNASKQSDRDDVVATTPRPSISTTTRPRRLDFFDLPAEIRNVIYAHVAVDTRIAIPLATKKSGKTPPPSGPSLLTVCKRTWTEFLPLLLELASITIMVKDFDFHQVQRISGSLYSTELKSLRNNKRLTIRLLAEKCDRASLVSLRRWLENRCRGLDRLPWRYAIAWKPVHQILPTSTSVHVVNTYLTRKKVLHQNLEGLSQLHKLLEEMVKFELHGVIEAFEMELERTGAEPAAPWRHHSSLMMHGVYAGAPAVTRDV